MRREEEVDGEGSERKKVVRGEKKGKSYEKGRKTKKKVKKNIER